MRRSTPRRDERTIPVVEEKLSTGKRRVETGRVRVHKTRRKRTETVDQPLIAEEFSIERVAVDTPAGKAPPAPHWEGDTLIVPVLEERLVVHREWWIREELRLTRHSRETHHPQEIELYSDEVHVERLGGSAEADERVSQPTGRTRRTRKH